MSEPYGVLNLGEWSVWCRACPWRGKPEPLTDRQVGGGDAQREGHLHLHRPGVPTVLPHDVPGKPRARPLSHRSRQWYFAGFVAGASCAVAP
jgi:hypothetical protein